MATQLWRLALGGKPADPQLTTAQLRALVASGKVGPETPIELVATRQIVPARKVQGLIPPATARLGAAPPVAVPTPPADDELHEALGVAPGTSLFRESAPSPTAPVAPSTAHHPVFDQPLQQPGSAAATPASPAPAYRASVTIPLHVPRALDLWPLVTLVLGFGWILGNWGTGERQLRPDDEHLVVLLALVCVPTAFVGWLHWLRPRFVPTRSAIGMAVFTGIAGVLALLALQWAAMFAAGGRLRVYGKLGLLLIVLFALGWAYRLTEHENFFARWAGYVFGVGLCEEGIKLVPLLWILAGAHQRMGLHTFMTLGFASGLGFGISEALYLYNPWHEAAPGIYRVSGVDGNVIRWCALVPSHALWTAACARFLWKRADQFVNADGFWEKALVVAMAAGAMAALHGTYDVICGLHPLVALLGDGAVFVALVWLVRHFSVDESDPESVPATADYRMAHTRPLMAGCLAVVLTGIGITAGLSSAKPDYEKAMVTVRRTRFKEELSAEWRPYVDGVDAEITASEPVALRFAFDFMHLDDGLPLVGTLSNHGTEPLAHLRVHCTDEEHSRTLTRETLAPGENWTFDHRAESGWEFSPGETLAVQWDGHEELLDVSVP